METPLDSGLLRNDETIDNDPESCYVISECLLTSGDVTRQSADAVLRTLNMKQRLLRAFSHRYGFRLFIVLASAGLTGIACVVFMRTFEFVLAHRLDFESLGAWCWLTTPLLFLGAFIFTQKTAPAAAGSGIPQVIFAAKYFSQKNERELFPLLSPLTLGVKVISLLIGLWAGASLGREGPTVHIAACIFLGLLLLVRRWTGIDFDFRSAAVAGGAAGLAAAFNTPLAGVTFAIEEITVDYFASIKDYVLMAIIIAAISARVLTGEYAYFGKLLDPPSVQIYSALVIGLAGGILGALFSEVLLKGQKMLARNTSILWKTAWPLILSLGILTIATFSGTRILGPGNEAAQSLIEGHWNTWALSFPFTKIGATLFTYWSGIAGGIFAPCLSIGAAIGSDIGIVLRQPVTSCALLGMAAFLSGTIQAPITSFVIIFEMAGHHQLLLPIMLSSILAYMFARLAGAKHLYQSLSNDYLPFIHSMES